MKWEDPTSWPPFQLCEPVKSLPTAPQWLFEEKVDGVRAMMSCFHLRLRNTLIQDHRLQIKMRSLVAGYVMDGEIVHQGSVKLIPAQIMSKIAKQQWDHLTFQPFDCLMTPDDGDISQRPLAERRQYLKRFGTPQVLAPDGQIPDDWEGVVGKRLDKPYQAGRQWVKKKNWWLMDALCTELQFRAGTLVTCTFALDNGIELTEIGKATVNDPIVYRKLRYADDELPVAIVVRHFGLRPNGVKNPHVVQVKL